MRIASFDKCDVDLNDLEETSSLIDERGTTGSLDHAPWEAYPYKPQVRFSIASAGNLILLKFAVKEKEVKAIHKTDNEKVCEDSCVEFFLSPEGSSGYYNFEFNCLGTALAAYGSSREDREQIPPEYLGKILRHSVIHDRNHWELLVTIPSELLIHHSISCFSGLTFKANFYKCGDLHKEPHYLTWSPVKSDQPDFHRSEYFRDIIFTEPG